MASALLSSLHPGITRDQLDQFEILAITLYERYLGVVTWSGNTLCHWLRTKVECRPCTPSVMLPVPEVCTLTSTAICHACQDMEGYST